ncbi:MAG: hypothetical protein WC455_10605 [Dehalococcoidia bacterium]
MGNKKNVVALVMTPHDEAMLKVTAGARRAEADEVRIEEVVAAIAAASPYHLRLLAMPFVPLSRGGEWRRLVDARGLFATRRAAEAMAREARALFRAWDAMEAPIGDVAEALSRHALAGMGEAVSMCEGTWPAARPAGRAQLPEGIARDWASMEGRYAAAHDASRAPRDAGRAAMRAVGR